MPIYEYECQACGDIQEVMQKLNDPAPAECVACHSGPMSKIMSRSGFILKGSGWYVTDFRDGGKKPSKSGGEGGGQGSGAEGASGKGSDAAPAPSTKPTSGGGGDSGSSGGSGDTKAAGCTPTGCGSSACAV